MALPVNPFAITRAQFLRLLSSPVMGRRVLYAADHEIKPWCELLKTVRPGGRGSERLLDYQSAFACYERIRDGQIPPLMPSEKEGEGLHQGRAAFLPTSRKRRKRR